MILIDTTPLVALCDNGDSQHAIAVKQLERLASRGLCTCEAVLMEACFHLPHREQRQRLRVLLDALPISPIGGTYDQNFWSEVFDWLTKYAEHEPDWADACIAVLCGQNRGLKVWTYDREFRTVRRRPDGTPIPLATRSLLKKMRQRFSKETSGQTIVLCGETISSRPECSAM